MERVVLLVFVLALPAAIGLYSLTVGPPYGIWLAVPSVVVGSLLVALVARDWRWLLIDAAVTIAICLGLLAFALWSPYAKAQAVVGQFAVLWGVWVLTITAGTAVSLRFGRPGQIWDVIVPRALGLAAPVGLIAALQINSIFW